MKHIKSIVVFAALLMTTGSMSTYYSNNCIDEVFAVEEYLGVELSYNVFNALVESCEARQ